MYLARRNRTYYLCYPSESGIERRVSTRCRTKQGALAFVRSFKEAEHERRLAIQHRLLEDFSEDFITYSKSVHTPNTTESYGSVLRELMRIIGNVPIQSVGIREIEKFLAIKKEEASSFYGPPLLRITSSDL